MNKEEKIANLIVNECFGEGATISIKTFNKVLELLNETLANQKKEILNIVDQWWSDENENDFISDLIDKINAL